MPHNKLLLLGSTAVATDTDAGTTASVSHTLAEGKNRLAICCVGYSDPNLNGGDIPTGVTYGGVAMTREQQIENTTSTNESGAAIFYYAIPNTTAAGAKTVTVTFGGGCNTIRVVVFVLENADPITQVDVAGTTATGTATSVSTALTPVTDRAWVVQCLTLESTDAITETGGQSIVDNTQINNGTDDLSILVAYKEVETPGSTVMSATFASHDFANALSAFRPARRSIKIN